jgi:hypothetical protein
MRRSRRAIPRARHRELTADLESFFLQTQWWSTVCDTPYLTGWPPTDRYRLTQIATLYALACRRILHARLPAILMMMDMMGLRKSFLVLLLLLLRCHNISLLFFTFGSTFFSGGKNTTQIRL